MHERRREALCLRGLPESIPIHLQILVRERWLAVGSLKPSCYRACRKQEAVTANPLARWSLELAAVVI